VVHQYRFLLRTAPLDAVEAAHAEALATLDPTARRAVLEAVRRGLVAGQRLGPDDVQQLAHLVAVGERREPNAFLRACPAASLLGLAEAVLASESSFGLLNGYASWDGEDPQPEDDSAWRDAGYNPDSGRWNLDRHVPIDWGGGGGGAAGGRGDGGGG